MPPRRFGKPEATDPPEHQRREDDEVLEDPDARRAPIARGDVFPFSGGRRCGRRRRAGRRASGAGGAVRAGGRGHGPATRRP